MNLRVPGALERSEGLVRVRQKKKKKQARSYGPIKRPIAVLMNIMRAFNVRPET